jgi:DNA topoisomerase-1
MTRINQYLVIVESPAKCKKIESFLGAGYKCIASFGHIRELTKNKGIRCIDVENDYKPDYSLVKHQLKNISMMKSYIKSSEEVLLATDDDREGEAIAWHICKVFNLPIKTTKRIIFHEITKPALEKAVLNPTIIDMKKVYSQQARQVLDLLVGYSISPLLWKYINKTSVSSLSAGRCQTPALRLVYDNYKSIKENPGIECYNITGNFTEKGLNFKLNESYEKKEEVEEFLELSVNHKHKIKKEKEKEVIKKAPEPLTTSSLQQKASNILHYSPKDTMRICQNLYECGYITYMRTDSKNYSKEFIEKTKEYILRKYDENYISKNIENLSLRKTESVNKKKKKEENKAQEAHEAIRPTKIEVLTITENNKLGLKEKRMYNLIWKTTVESCMSDALYKSLTININGPLETKYKYKEEEVIFEGWTIIENNEKVNKNYRYIESLKNNEIVEYNKISSDYALKNTKQHYTEAKLVSLLEKQGIGRPSTFSSIISKIQERNYVNIEDIEGREIECVEYELIEETIEEKKKKKKLGKENKKLVIQPLGILVVEFLIKYFPDIFSYEYTKMMEEDLDIIALGKKVWYELCDECYKKINSIKEEMGENVKKEHEYDIDDNHKYRIARYGPVIETKDEEGKKKYLKIKEGITLEEIKKGELTLEEIIETREEKIRKELLGRIENEEVIIKKGKYGYYVIYKEKNYSLKGIKKSVDEITIEDIKELIEENKTKGVKREINKELSIRNGKYGDYIYYKTEKMKKPKFIPIKKCPLKYLECSKEEFIEWFEKIK